MNYAGTVNLLFESMFYAVNRRGVRSSNSNPQPPGPSGALNRIIAGLAFALISLVVLVVLGSLFLVRDPETVQTALQEKTRTNFTAQLATFRRVFPLIGGAAIFGVAIAALSALRRVKRLQDDATTDPLTGIYNRSEVRNRLAELLWNQRNERVAALSVDLDEFGDVNDNWGRDAGDALLVALTQRLAAAVGDAGFIGRLGGDEFLAVISLPPTANAAERVQQVIAQTTGEPVTVGASHLELKVNCGFVVREPGDTSDQVTLLRNADAALLSAKASDSDVVQFATDMSFPSVGDAARRTELVQHVARDDFEFYFQPEVDLATGKVVGAEALLRLWLPDGTVAPAYTFIEDVERLHVIDLLTPKLLATSRRLAEEIDDPSFTVRINLCGEQICNNETLAAIAAVNDETSVQWCIEITERTIVEANSKTVKQLRRLVNNGVTLALDDFGTGYSSFSELANLPISAIKIDRSFIEPLTPKNASASLASVIFEVAKRLSLNVVAEGIETEDQRRALSHIGCNQGQGWLFGKAVPLDDFVATSPIAAPPLAM